MYKIWSWLAIGICMIGLYLWQPTFFQTAYGLIQQRDITELANYLRSFGGWSVGITLGLFVAMTFTIVFPFLILSGATGLMYGLFWGTAVSWVGEVLGALVMFVFARCLLRKTIADRIAQSRYMSQVDCYSADNGFKALLLARLLPVAPSGVITAVAGISKMHFREFLLATMVGKLPPIIVKVMLGYDLIFAGEHPLRIMVVVGIVLMIYAVAWEYNRKTSRAVTFAK